MIKIYNEKHINSVMQIWKEENIKSHSFISKEYWENNFDFVKSILPDAEIYIDEYNNEITGFIGIKENYIEGIFVKSEYQGSGIGTALLNKAKQKHRKLTLNVYIKNTNAINFYKKNGFEIISKNIDEATGEAEYTMLWERKSML